MKKTIQELIVVEGKHDSDTLKKYFDCDTIETGGTGFTKETIDVIAFALKRRGVIIFTDPDSPGNRIRNALNQAVPGCKNAFVDKKDARTNKKVGVEHADEKTLQEALEHLVTYAPIERITAMDMYELGLSGHEDSQEKRELIGKKYHIGFANAKTMRIRLNCLNITKEELLKDLKQ